jgi:cytochrome c oxidase subunit III
LKKVEIMTSTTYSPSTVAAQPLAIGKGQPSRSGIWVALFAITMSFAAFTSALYVRQGSGDWQHIVLPPIMYVNTLALLISSFTMEMSRRAIERALRSEARDPHNSLGWLAVTLFLGLAFVTGQYLAWRHLAAQGVYLATNSNSSFFYVFTAMHALHLLGGIAALVYLIGRLAGSRSSFRRSLFDATAIYWHFMGVLWLYLLLVICTRL